MKELIESLEVFYKGDRNRIIISWYLLMSMSGLLIAAVEIFTNYK